MSDQLDREICDQLRAWADDLAVRSRDFEASSTGLGAPAPNPWRRRGWSGVLVAAAAVLLVVLISLFARNADPAPVTTTLPSPTTVAEVPDDALPLGGTRWETQRDADTKVVFEIQRVRDGRGRLVGLTGLDGPTFCSALDADVTVDGDAITFTGVTADTSCAGAADVVEAFTTVARWQYGRWGDEIFLLDENGATAFRMRGCDAADCSGDGIPTVTAPVGPITGLTSVGWYLHFPDSGLIAAGASGFDAAALIEFDDRTITVLAGVAGGCMAATADYSVDGTVLTVGEFEFQQDSCGPSIHRLPGLLTGSHEFSIDGDTLTIDDLRFSPPRTASP